MRVVIQTVVTLCHRIYILCNNYPTIWGYKATVLGYWRYRWETK